MHRRTFLSALACATAFPRVSAAAGWRAGLASVDITPPLGLWMAGFAARKEPARGIAQPLHAKALALEDAGGRRAVIVTMDLLGLTAPVVERIAGAVRRRCGVPRERLLLCSSHTHSGPVVDDQLAVAYDLTTAQREDIRRSTRRIEGQVVDVVGRALAALGPARLRQAQGEAGFGANRRVTFQPLGPVDPAVPVLAIERPGGSLAGLLFGYACHNTTLVASFVQYHGDYAGVAQAELERRHPGVVAMFVQGCGADANPNPRGTLELAEEHGRSLAGAVERALGTTREVGGPIRSAFATVAVPYAAAPGAEEWRRKLDDSNVYVRRHAKLMLDVIARDGRTRAAEPVPLHVLRVGQSAMIGIGGEVVADYALALKRKYGDATWVAGYVDAVFGYLPSLRVLREGGYEGGDAMLYFGRPSPFAESVETTVMAGIDGLMARTSPAKGRAM